MRQSRARWGIDINSPVILCMTFLSLAIVLGEISSGGVVNRYLAAYYTSWTDPMQYLRLFTHVVAHADLSHYTSNFMMILAVGPMIEEKYGSERLAVMILITAIVTGLINTVFFRNIAVLGASGIVFMLILLASFTNIRQGRLPITVLLVGVLYIGNEVVAGLFTVDNISRISHIAGGLCGACFGVFFHAGKMIGGER